MKRLLAIMAAATVLIMAFPHTIYAEYIERGTHTAYISGYPDGTIRPGAYLTREEAASMLYRIFLQDGNARYTRYSLGAFEDVGAGRWSFEAVNALYDCGAVSGDEGLFRPGGDVTRAEMASMIYRLAGEGPGTKKFNDTDGHWAQKYIENVAAEGWMAGYNDGSFRPDEKITRAETVFLINSVLGRQPENKEALLEDMKVWKDNTDETKWYYLAIQEASNSHEYALKDNGYEIWNLVKY